MTGLTFREILRYRLSMGALHSYTTAIRWTGAGETGTSSYTAYSRDHVVEVAGKPPILGSADPAFRGDPARHNPEELFVAAIAQCHMLWFLHLAAAAGLTVRGYSDEATGTMRVESAGAGQFTEVTLHPRVELDDTTDPSALEPVHHLAHQHCFLSRSVNFPVHVRPTSPLVVETAGEHRTAD